MEEKLNAGAEVWVVERDEESIACEVSGYMFLAEVADFVITKALQKNDPDFKQSDLKKLEDVWETRAREAILSKLEQ